MIEAFARAGGRSEPDSVSESGEPRDRPRSDIRRVNEMQHTQASALAEVYARALEARDPRFDGVFFVGITTTRIYCRPVCPARVSYPERRRFFPSAAAAERAGYRPCLRCRPELAPGRATMDAIPRLARVAACRIAAGALNGRPVADLARELGVSERHLRRALERELGVTPIELALTHRLLLAKRLLADTRLPITQIAFASGFQSLRWFNAVFRERYGMSPSALRRPTARGRGRHGAVDPGGRPDFVRLTLSYRPPLAWTALLEALRRDVVRGIDAVEGGRYLSTVRVGEHVGVVIAEDAASNGERGRAARCHVNVDLSVELLPVLMPVLSRLRQLLDLDADPSVIDAQLQSGGLGALVRACPGVRVPGALDGFDLALRVLLRGGGHPSPFTHELVRRVMHALGDPVRTDVPGLCRLAPDARRVVDAGVRELVRLGVRDREACRIVDIAVAVAESNLRLEPGADPKHALGILRARGIDEPDAAYIVMRTLGYPDAFSEQGVSLPSSLAGHSDRWRPWRAYAAVRLWVQGGDVARTPAV